MGTLLRYKIPRFSGVASGCVSFRCLVGDHIGPHSDKIGF